MNVRKIILSTAAFKYLGFAEHKYEELEQRRKNVHAPVLKKFFVINGILIELIATEFYGKIIMWGGEAGHIILAGPSAWLLDYETGTLKPGPAGLGFADHSFFDGLVHFDGAALGADLKTQALPSALVSHADLARHARYEVEYVYEEDVLSFLQSTGKTPFVTLPAGDWQHDMATAGGSYLFLPRMLSTSYNLLNGPDIWHGSPGNATFVEHGQWLPAVWFNIWGMGADEGYQSGKLYYDVFGPFTRIEVDFGGICTPYGNKGYGHCEIVRRWVNTDYADNLVPEERNDIHFLISENVPSIPASTNNTFFKWGVSGYKYIGTAREIKTTSFSLSYPLADPVVAVDMWSFISQDPGLSGEWLGVSAVLHYCSVVKLTSGAAYLAVRGQPVATIANYHSHCISSDGRKIAIFDALEGKIQNAYIYDLDEQDVWAVRLVNTIDVSQCAAQMGAWIPTPRPVDDIKPAVKATTDTTIIDDYNTQLYSPQQGGVYIYYDNNGWHAGTQYWKMWQEGVSAIAEVFTDECFLWKLTAAYKDGSGPVSFTVEGDTRGYASFEGAAGADIPKMLGVDDSIGAGLIIFGSWASSEGLNEVVPKETAISVSGAGVGTVERRPVIVTVENDGRVTVQFDVEPTALSGVSVTEIGGEFFVNNYGEACGELTATDSCGMAATTDVMATAEIVVTGDATYLTNATNEYDVNREDFTVSASCGAVILGSYGFSVDFTGCCGAVTLEVGDACGYSTTKTVNRGDLALSITGNTAPAVVSSPNTYTYVVNRPAGVTFSGASVVSQSSDANSTSFVVSFDGQCGTKTLTASHCGDSVSLPVKMPDGQWVVSGPDVDMGSCRPDYLRLCNFVTPANCRVENGTTATMYSGIEYGCTYAGAANLPAGCSPNNVLPGCVTTVPGWPGSCSPACDFFALPGTGWQNTSTATPETWECP